MDMLAAGHLTFYLRDETGRPAAHYSPQARDYVPVPRSARPLSASSLRAASDAPNTDRFAVADMGDGVALLDLGGATFDDAAQAALWKALDWLDRGYDALVVGGDGDRFLTGLNPKAQLALRGDKDALARSIRRRQALMQAVREASRPVVVAPYGQTLGAGAELMLSAARVVAHVELYAGEMDFMSVPPGGAIAALLRRRVNPVAAVAGADVFPLLRAQFDQLAAGKVSGSATEARAMGLLDVCDRIVMSRDTLLETARREALHLADGYRPPTSGKIWAAGRPGYEALIAHARQTSNQEVSLAARGVAAMLCGGEDTEPGWVDEQVFLDLEYRLLTGDGRS
jgi:3-hydroxyacyl-CoA dehydrogenase